jgi:hypothetical protein
MWGLIVATIATFYPVIGAWAPGLLVPYLVWVSYATALTMWIWRNTPAKVRGGWEGGTGRGGRGGGEAGRRGGAGRGVARRVCPAAQGRRAGGGRGQPEGAGWQAAAPLRGRRCVTRAATHTDAPQRAALAAFRGKATRLRRLRGDLPRSPGARRSAPHPCCTPLARKQRARRRRPPRPPRRAAPSASSCSEPDAHTACPDARGPKQVKAHPIIQTRSAPAAILARSSAPSWPRGTPTALTICTPPTPPLPLCRGPRSWSEAGRHRGPAELGGPRALYFSSPALAAHIRCNGGGGVEPAPCLEVFLRECSALSAPVRGARLAGWNR